MSSAYNPHHGRPSVETTWSVLAEGVGRGGTRPNHATAGKENGGGLDNKPVFTELTHDRNGVRGGPRDSQLWESGSAKKEDAHRLSLRSLETILSPTSGAADIINAVAFAMSSQGLRLVERDSFRIRGQRIEASFLPNQPREEWRVVDARLGVSKGFPSWVLLLEFKTDSCPKQNRGAVALACVAERLGSSANTAAAITIAHRRSDGRALSLVEAIVGELGQIDGVMQPDNLGDGGIDAFLDGTKDVVLAPFKGKSAEPELRDGYESRSASASSKTPQEEDSEVRLCLHFVEGLCARAEEYSRRDAQESWRPLEDTMHRLERENEKLRWILEPKYRAMSAAPPSVPTWTDRRRVVDGPSSRAIKTDSEDGETAAWVAALLQASPLLAFEGMWVKSRVLADANQDTTGLSQEGDAAVAASPAKAGLRDCSAVESINGGPDNSPAIEPSAAAVVGRNSDGGGSIVDESSAVAGRMHSVLILAVVKVIAEWISGVCEAREEELLKARLPGAQAYVEQLERYQSSIVGGAPLRMTAAIASGSRGDAAVAGGLSPEVDDDLYRLFGAIEMRLYSSSAALGKKPGRIYLTFNTLWFHSKVLGFESRLILPLAEVKSVAILGTALDLSSSLVLTKKDGGEVMLVFPGQRLATLEPLQILIRQLAILAAKEARGDA